MIILLQVICIYHISAIKLFSGSCVLYAGCCMSETSSQYVAGGIRLPESMLQMKRYIFLSVNVQFILYSLATDAF